MARCRSVYQRTTGAVLSPLSAFLLLQGIETVALRVDRHVENARHVAVFLRDHPAVEWINYVDFRYTPHYNLAQKYLGGRPCSLITFGVQGGFEAGRAFYHALRLVKRLVNLGDAKSLACHPAFYYAPTDVRYRTAQSGRRTPDYPAQRRHIEHTDDLIADLRQALDEGGKWPNLLDGVL